MMKRKTLILASLALVLVLSASIGSTMAYFTTYADARGGYPLQYEQETVEWLSNWTKHVSIKNLSDSQPVYVRARAVWSNDYTITYKGDGWTEGEDGWWYFDSIVPSGKSTSDLDVLISDVPEDVKDGASFNIVVYTECTPATNGEPDWSNIVASSEQQGGAVNE